MVAKPVGAPCYHRRQAGPSEIVNEGEDTVPTFILLSTLTDAGAQTVKVDPERIRAVDQELERMGVHVVSQWAVLGPYDFVNVVEAPDIAAVVRVSTRLSSRGSVRIMTLPAVPIDEFIEGFQPRRQ
jgi:uncharacterized protein with GYD domain